MSYSSEVLADSPLAYYRLGEAAGLGTATASTNYPSEPPANAFDGNPSTFWTTNGVSSGWLRNQLTAAYAAAGYKITRRDDYPARNPKDWTFEGSNDGTTWTTLDTRTGITWPTVGETKPFTFSNTTSYTYYRLNVTANNGDTYLSVAELSIDGIGMMDSSGNAHHGIYLGVTLGAAGLLSGDPDTAVTINGATARGEVADAAWMDTGTALTVEAWIKTSATGVYQYIIDRDTTGRLWDMRLRPNGNLEVEKIAGTYASSLASTTLNDGNPHHVAFTYDGSNIRLYADGSLVQTTAASGSLDGAANLAIGATYAGTGNYGPHRFQGIVDEVAYYGTALSSTRIAAHYAAGTASPPASGTIAATLPVATGLFSGTYHPHESGTFAATLPHPLTASLTGTYTAPPTGTFAATLPTVTADFAGTYTAPVNPTGVLGAVLPVVTASFTGDYHPHEAGTFEAVLPFPTAEFTGTYTPGLESGTFDAVLPVVTASFDGTYHPLGDHGDFAAVLPLVVASFAGTYDGPVPTDTSNSHNGRRRGGRATTSVDRPPAPTPPGRTYGPRVDKAIAYPVPTMVDGRPT